MGERFRYFFILSVCGVGYLSLKFASDEEPRYGWVHLFALSAPREIMRATKKKRTRRRRTRSPLQLSALIRRPTSGSFANGRAPALHFLRSLLIRARFVLRSSTLQASPTPTRAPKTGLPHSSSTLFHFHAVGERAQLAGRLFPPVAAVVASSGSRARTWAPTSTGAGKIGPDEQHAPECRPRS